MFTPPPMFGEAVDFININVGTTMTVTTDRGVCKGRHLRFSIRNRYGSHNVSIMPCACDNIYVDDIKKHITIAVMVR